MSKNNKHRKANYMNIKAIFKILIVFLILMMMVNVVTYATNLSDPNQFDDYGSTKIPGAKNGATVESLIVKILGVLLTLLRIIALGWAIMMSCAIAVKYMMAKPSTKSALKLDMPTYVIGAVLLFGASGLMKLMQYFVEDIFA